MRSHVIFFSAAALFVTSMPVAAATFNFRATKTGAAWTCADQSKPDAARDGVTVNLQVDGTPDAAKVVLQVNYTEAGAAKQAAVPHSSKTLWQFVAKEAKPDEKTALTVSGTIDGATLSCSATVQFAAAQATAKPGTSALPAASHFDDEDALAVKWLRSDQGRTATEDLVKQVETERRVKRDRFVLLRHMPSGGAAFPFPESVSEHQVMQIAMVVNMRKFSSVDVTFGACERPLRERIKGDFGVFAARAEGEDSPPPDFALVPVGALFQCGPDVMSYSLSVTQQGSDEKATPAPARLEVRPVYHLGATALIGFDWTQQPSFAVKSAKVARSDDRVGSSLYVGGTWFPFGVDYGRMRAWNYLLNPFAAVAIDSPKENFVVGNAFTVTGGISIAIGAAFHRLDQLDGIADGDAFTGDGAVPTVKKWTKDGIGLFFGVAVDTNVFKALKSMKAPAAAAK